MPRGRRRWVSQEWGAFHIISHTVENTPLFSEQEKKYFFQLMRRLSQGFFINIHSYCIMGNHFHILATGMELDAKHASKEELIRRYKAIYGKDSEYPTGAHDGNIGSIIPDEDGGIERLRERLGSISRFVQELKQNFTRWYNKKHNRKGYLWRERYKGVIVYHGMGELVCSAYIDLNPLRAGIVKLPEDYKWSSLSIRIKAPRLTEKFLYPITYPDAMDNCVEGKDNDDWTWIDIPLFPLNKDMREVEWYRQYVYAAGGIPVPGKAQIPERMLTEVLILNKDLGTLNRLCFGVRNISYGIAIGGYETIENLQKNLKRKVINARSFINSHYIRATRVLRL